MSLLGRAKGGGFWTGDISSDTVRALQAERGRLQRRAVIVGVGTGVFLVGGTVGALLSVCGTRMGLIRAENLPGVYGLAYLGGLVCGVVMSLMGLNFAEEDYRRRISQIRSIEVTIAAMDSTCREAGCGSTNPQGARFCCQCGAKLGGR